MIDGFIIFLVYVSCTPSAIVATFTLNREFNGRVYARNNPEGCGLTVENRANFNVTLNLNTPELCGITEEVWVLKYLLLID